MMRLDDLDYKKLLAAAYQKIKDNGTSARLSIPTRGSIREECIEVYRARFDSRDQHVLTDFFGAPNPRQTMLEVIEGSVAEDFRNLHNYMTGVNNTTSNKNTELLAWLIDFRHRPNRLNNMVELNEEEKIILDITETPIEPIPLPRPIGDPPNPKPNDPSPDTRGWIERLPKWVKKGAVVTGIAAIGYGVYAIIVDPPEKKCMYWTGDHYEKVGCSEKANGRFIIPIDEDQMQVQRINQEDTITEKHIGKLYYIKDKNDIQYFTQGGKYPNHLGRELQELSQYIFYKDSANRKSSKTVQQ